ncbi:MAG: chemotaxis protein CheA [Vampirovibrio sp.]|nr:chemotaxis protein CheA [Vampirovibrio sp.]
MMMNASFDDESLIQEFITESQEHLSDIEPDLLELEAQAPSVDQEIVNKVFRAIHSIKGAAGFFGFERLKNLSHVMESVLMRIRDKQLTPESYIVEPLLVGVDLLRDMVEDIQNSEQVDCEALVPELNHYIKDSTRYQKDGAKATTAKAEKASVTVASIAADAETTTAVTGSALPFEVAAGVLQQYKNQGQSFFLLKISAEKHLFASHRTFPQFVDLLKSCGSFLGSNVTKEEEEAPPEEVICLIGTVLEIDLLAGAFDVPTDCITLYDCNIQANSATVVEKVTTGKAKLEVGNSNTTTAVSKPATPEKKEAPPTPATAGAKTASSAEAAVETIRVRVDLLNKLMDFAGELVLSRNQLIRATSQENAEQDKEGFNRIVQSIDTVTSYLQEHIMQTRMQPIEAVFRKFPRVVRDLASQLNKKINLEMVGQDVELDKTILESLSDPLTHMIRNCCDHGIETPEVRQANGKAPQGTIVLHAYHEGGQINLSIKDNGNGIDTARVGKKAISSGVITQAEFDAMTHQERLNLIFHAGLSTAEKLSDVSGRGVGMDVVRSNIERLGGHIHLESTLGQGSTITLQLPLTLAIIPSLVVGLQHHRFAIPQVNLLELVRIKANEIHQKIERCGRASVFRLRGKLLPLVKLADVLQLDKLYIDPSSGNAKTDRRQSIEDTRFEDPVAIEQIPAINRTAPVSDYNILVLRVGANQYGLIVDEVFDTEEIVVKPLSSYIKNCKCFSGTTIMGDGKVAMICDVGGIVTQGKLNFGEVEAEESRRKDVEAKRQEMASLSTSKTNHGERQAIILFSNHPEERFALPLSSLLRLEKIKIKNIEVVGSREFINYRGESLPLIRLEDHLSVRPSPSDAETAYMIVPKHGGGRAGIYATKILDTIETNVVLDSHIVSDSQVKGSAIIQDHLTLFLNTEVLLESAGIWLEEEVEANPESYILTHNHHSA